jgi:hypothetical protein
MAKKHTFKKYRNKNNLTKKARGINVLNRVTFKDPNHPQEITMYMTKPEEKKFRKKFNKEIKQYNKTAKANKINVNKKDTKANRFFNFLRRKKVTPVFKKKSESSNKKSSSFDFIKPSVRQNSSSDSPTNPYFKKDKHAPLMQASPIDFAKLDYYDANTGIIHYKK